MNLEDENYSPSKEIIEVGNDESSCSKKSNTIPFIITHCYIYDDDNIANKGNKIKCKGCGVQLSYHIGDRTTNLINHIE